jgi:hypothetical protein
VRVPATFTVELPLTVSFVLNCALVQRVAFVEDHVSVTEAPVATVVALAENVMVGVGRSTTASITWVTGETFVVTVTGCIAEADGAEAGFVTGFAAVAAFVPPALGAAGFGVMPEVGIIGTTPNGDSVSDSARVCAF